MSIVLVAAAVIGAMIGIKAGEESNKKNRQRRFEASKQEYKPLEQAQNINTQNNPSEPVIPVENYYTVDLFHGTPDKEKLFGILNQQAFVIGDGNKYGSGVYWTTQFKKAQEYAGRNGGIVKARLQCPSSQIVGYAALSDSDSFKKWKKQSGISNEGDAITAYCLNHLNKRFLKIDDHTYVALAHRTAMDDRVRFQGITIHQ